MRRINRLQWYLSKFNEQNTLPFLTAVYVGAVLLLSPSSQLNDGDTLWHIKLGQEIIEKKKLPEHDSFSYLFEGEIYRTTSWLSDVLLGAAFNFGSFPAVVALSTFAVSLTFYILQKEYLRHLSNIMAICFCCAAFLLLAPHILSRPHVLVFPLIALWSILVIDAKGNRETPSLKTLPVFFLWSNMHGSFILGFVIIIPLCLFSIYEKSGEHYESARSWAFFIFCMLVVTLIGPYGVNLLTASLNVVNLGYILNYVNEWKPQDFSKFGTFEFILLLAIGLIPFHGVKIAPGTLAILLGLLHMALSHVRSADYLAITGSLILAEPMGRSFRGRNITINAKTLMPAFAIIIGAEIALMLVFKPLAPPDKVYPSKAIRAVKELGQGNRVFNDYGLSGALIFEGVKVFIDSRQELYPKEFQQQYYNIFYKDDPTEVGAYLDRYKIDFTLLGSTRALATEIGKLPNWRELYRDETAVIHARIDRSMSSSH